MLTLRAETSDDYDAIRDVTSKAFEGKGFSDGTELYIPGLLRDAGALVFSHVAELDGAIVGHVALSPVGVGQDWESFFALGPISVLPEYQRQGVGTALIAASVEFAKTRAEGIILMGDPGYYGQFGFAPISSASKHLQVLSFGASPQGEVTWHAAFGVD